MKRILCILLMVAAVEAQAGMVITPQDTVASFQEKIEIYTDGSLDVTITCTPVDSKVMDLPMEYGTIEEPRILSGAYVFDVDENGNSVAVIEKRGATYIRLIPSFDSEVADSVVVVKFHVPDYFNWKKSIKSYGVVQFSKTFLNTSDYFIKKYEMDYMLPEGYLLHRIAKTEPSYNPKKQPVPPYEVEKLDGHYRVVLTVENMGAASRALLGIELLKIKRSMLPLAIGIVLSILYLVFFRDVLKVDKRQD